MNDLQKLFNDVENGKRPMPRLPLAIRRIFPNMQNDQCDGREVIEVDLIKRKFKVRYRHERSENVFDLSGLCLFDLVEDPLKDIRDLVLEACES